MLRLFGKYIMSKREAQLAYGALQEVHWRSKEAPADYPPLSLEEDKLRQELERKGA